MTLLEFVFQIPPEWAGLSALILVVLAWKMRQVCITTNPIAQMLNELVELVNKHNSNSKEFWAGWIVIGEKIGESSALSHAWEKYKGSVIFDEKQKIIKYTAHPAAHFNIQAVDSDGHIGAVQAWPNYFVGVGLLFTFVGLLAAMLFAGHGLADGVDNQEELKKSLEALMSAAAFKFMTSITGLLASIILSMYYRHHVNKLQNCFVRFCEALEKGMLFTTQEYLANSELAELKRQSVQIEGLSTDLAVQLGAVLEKKLDNSLEAAVRTVGEEIKRLAEKIGTMNQDAMAQLVKEFIEALHDAAGKEMQAVAQTIQGAADSLKGVAANIDNAGNNFGRQLTHTLAEAVDQIEGLLNQLTRGSTEAAKTLIESIEKGGSDLIQSLAPLGTVVGHFGRSVDELDDKLNSQRDAFQDTAIAGTGND